MFHALIMAGGSGTRLWPLSRKLMPKQALALLGDRTMFQVTVERLASIIPIERVHVVTNDPDQPVIPLTILSNWLE